MQLEFLKTTCVLNWLAASAINTVVYFIHAT